MKGLAYAIVALTLFFPVTAGEGPETEPQEEAPCDFFAWTLEPEFDYRIDPDCPPLGSFGP